MDVLRRRRGTGRGDGRGDLVFRFGRGVDGLQLLQLYRLKLHYSVGYVRFVVRVVFVGRGRRGGRVVVVVVVVHFDLEALLHGAIAIAVAAAAVHVTAVERSSTASAAIAAVAVAVAAADVAAAASDVICNHTGVAVAGRRRNRGGRGRSLHHDRHQQPVVIVVRCRRIGRFPRRHLLDHIIVITVVALKCHDKNDF